MGFVGHLRRERFCQLVQRYAGIESRLVHGPSPFTDGPPRYQHAVRLELFERSPFLPVRRIERGGRARQHPADIVGVEYHDHPAPGHDQFHRPPAELRAQLLPPPRRALVGLDPFQHSQHGPAPRDHAGADCRETEVHQRGCRSEPGQSVRMHIGHSLSFCCRRRLADCGPVGLRTCEPADQPDLPACLPACLPVRGAYPDRPRRNNDGFEWRRSGPPSGVAALQNRPPLYKIGRPPVTAIRAPET
ncbi:hypothetical protein [Nocardia carnea]|uniref:Uncharacterized protein n=1 Tax=Nocardia carnea TaxID=37328 RepID=A0ABW7TM53_9NOCA|nr:hypothetical protein [Nocardia carnea]